jgi:segregation and condensation protein B
VTDAQEAAQDQPPASASPASRLGQALEALLLVAEEPVAQSTLARVLEVDDEEVAQALRALRADYVDQQRGFVLREAGGGWRLYTDPAMAAYVERFVQHGRSGKISQAALETLAIIAYKQPVTRGQVGEIRGVDADGAVRSLLQRGLIQEVGRDPSPGQPLLYGTTAAFLEQLGLTSLDELPALPDFDPGGDPPPEPPQGGYKAARQDLGALADELAGPAAEPDVTTAETHDSDDGHQPPTT